jgi:hypothetical protein
MAQFMKIESSDATNPEVFIGIGEVTHIKLGDPSNASPTSKITIVYGDASTCTVDYTGGATAGVPVKVLKAFNAALVANPGGQVSTVGKPLVTPQVVEDPAGAGTAIDGIMYITTPAVYVTYGTVVFA